MEELRVQQVQPLKLIFTNSRCMVHGGGGGGGGGRVKGKQ